jgi:hypothetical protein
MIHRGEYVPTDTARIFIRRNSLPENHEFGLTAPMHGDHVFQAGIFGPDALGFLVAKLLWQSDDAQRFAKRCR